MFGGGFGGSVLGCKRGVVDVAAQWQQGHLWWLQAAGGWDVRCVVDDESQSVDGSGGGASDYRSCI